MAGRSAGVWRCVVNDRLDVFLASQRRRYAEQVPTAGPSTWPALEGCLAVLCASRSGSTLLCREIESRYRFRRINESLRLDRLAKLAATKSLASVEASIAETVRMDSEAGWFGFKAGAEALLVGETSGFLPANLDRFRLILLVRRDLVAQAVSLTKAQQTTIWHSNQIAKRAPEDTHYSAAQLAQSLRRVLAALETLRLYAKAARVPSARLFYEDFAEGDPSTIGAACDGLALPRRNARRTVPWRQVARIGDAVNLEWAGRFTADMDSETADLVARYAAFCETSLEAWDSSLAPAPAAA